MNRLLLSSLILIFISCQKESRDPVGLYELVVSTDKNELGGILEIVGEADDYFGKLVIKSKKERIYEVGLDFKSQDSLSFFLPGQGGFLRLKKNQTNWKGTFKYFGLKADIVALKKGEPSKEMQSLVSLKPIGKGILSSKAEESFPTYDSKAKKLYFCRDNILVSSQQLANDQWGEPDTLPFSGPYDDSAPYLSKDGSSLLFTSTRSSIKGSNKKNLWMVRKQSDSWTEPIQLPEPINIDTLGDYHGGMTADGNIYFVSYNRQGGYGRSDIYKGVQLPNGQYRVEHLDATINTAKSEADLYIDPQEEYLIFASTGREEGYGADDLYISYRKGTIWQKPQNLGPEVNSFAYEYGAWVDQEAGYLYFNSFRRGSSDIYRIPLKKISVLN